LNKNQFKTHPGKAMAPRQRKEHGEDSSSCDDVSTTALLLEERKNSRYKPTMPTTSTSMPTSKPLTLNITESDIARDNHDFFNLVALPFVLVACGINYEFPSGAYKGDYFWIMWTTTILYFFLDLSWVIVVPICVKSPDVIKKHHIVAMLYLLSPIIYPQYSWLMGALLSVEINTWFLICRRIVYRSYYCRSYPAVDPIITTAVSTLFYITWIYVRCYLYPHILVLFMYIWKEEIELTGVYLRGELIFIPIHIVLCVLNLKWTHDLFKPIIKRWFGTGPKSMVVQNGL